MRFIYSYSFFKIPVGLRFGAEYCFWVWRRALYGGLSKPNSIKHERYGNPCEISDAFAEGRKHLSRISPFISIALYFLRGKADLYGTGRYIYDIQSDLLNADFSISSCRRHRETSGFRMISDKSGRLSVKLFAKKQMIDFIVKWEAVW